MSMMKGFSNAFRIPELRKKILITLGLVFVCRLVSQIPTPGVDWTALKSAIDNLRANDSKSRRCPSSGCIARLRAFVI